MWDSISCIFLSISISFDFLNFRWYPKITCIVPYLSLYPHTASALWTFYFNRYIVDVDFGNRLWYTYDIKSHISWDERGEIQMNPTRLNYLLKTSIYSKRRSLMMLTNLTFPSPRSSSELLIWWAFVAHGFNSCQLPWLCSNSMHYSCRVDITKKANII